MEYVTAWLLEQSLSLDNIFVWVLIFQHFKIEDDAQQRVLFWGIMGAMALRGIFIFAGAALINAFEWLLYLRSEEHTSELKSLMRISYAVFCMKKKTNRKTIPN